MNPFRRPMIAGNWKMNAGGGDACELASGVAQATADFDRVDVLVAPPFTALAAVSHELSEKGGRVAVAGQNMHAAGSGAFTGEISASMLKDAGATWVILGHSERRHIFGETDEVVAGKTKAAFEAGINPIVCVGETLDEREADKTIEVVERQVGAVLELLAAHVGVGVIAYEPVWAIGTGKVAEPADAQDVHAKIRGMLEGVSEELAEATRILYGGSVKADNAAGLLGQDDIDGALVGGAALKADGFGKIAEAAQAIAVEEGDGDAEGGGGAEGDGG